MSSIAKCSSIDTMSTNERSERDKEKKVVLLFASARHVGKCERGNECAVCGKLSPEKKEALRQLCVSTPAWEHYLKCRIKPTAVRVRCICGFVRAYMAKMAKKMLPVLPLPLQLLSSCAVPMGPELFLHPVGEEVMRLKWCAVLVQRRWRKYLKARGLYRVTPCRFYYQPGGCRNGVDCTFAHGHHDIRSDFVHEIRRREALTFSVRDYRPHSAREEHTAEELASDLDVVQRVIFRLRLGR
eukprot:scaffold8050_cov180-Amphora_coffeaeformis.AAC.4